LIATSGAALLIVSALNPEAMIFVKKLEKKATKIEKKTKKVKNFKKIDTEKTLFCFVWEKEGKKLCVKAPSANIRLKRFGSLNATIKISVYIFAPSIEA